MTEILDDNLIPQKKQYEFKSRIIIIWSIIILIGIIFKFMRWPGGIVFYVVGSAGLSAYSFSGFLTLKGKHPVNNAFFCMSLVWILFLLYGIYFNGGYPINGKGFSVFLGVFAAYFIFYGMVKKYRNWRSDN